MHLRACTVNPVAATPRLGFASLVILSIGLGAGSLASAADQPDLATLIQEARTSFQPVTPDQVQSARSALEQAAGRLDRWLGRSRTQGPRWREYLGWEALQQQLAAEQPDLPTLLAVERRLTTNKGGLEHENFRTLAAALDAYIDASSAAARPNLEEVFQRQLAALEGQLQQYAAEPTPRLEHAIGQRLRFMERVGAAPQLVDAVRSRYAMPNLLVDVSASLVSAAVSEPIDEVGPVSDYILGTSIRGTAHTTGQLDVRLIPADDRAIVEFHSQGHSSSQNRGYNRPVIIRSTGETDFTVVKQVEFTDPVFRLMPSVAEASTRTQIHSVRAQRNGPFSGIISRMGRQQANESKHQAERIASRHAETRVRRELDDQLLEEVKSLRRQYRDEFRYPLLRNDAFPQYIRFSSSSERASVEMTQARRHQLGAPTPPPALSTGHDLVARLHQTAANNYATALLGGATLGKSRPDEEPQLDVVLPGWIEDLIDEFQGSDEDTEVESVGPQLETLKAPYRPWSVTFRRSRAVSFQFSDGQATLIVHAARLVSGGDQFDNWDLIASYALHPQNGGLFLIREGDIDVLPTGFDPDAGRGLSTGDVAVRSNLIKVINELTDQGDGFPETIDVPMISPTGDLADVGALWLHEAIGADGWLTLVWDRQ